MIVYGVNRNQLVLTFAPCLSHSSFVLATILISDIAIKIRAHMGTIFLYGTLVPIWVHMLFVGILSSLQAQRIFERRYFNE